MTAPLTEGALLPPLHLPTAAGGHLRLSAYRGRHNLALFVLPGDDPSRLHTNLAAIETCLPRYRDEHSQPIGLITGPLLTAQGIQAELQLSFPLLADPAGKVSQLLGDSAATLGEPQVFLTDRYLEIRAHLTGWGVIEDDMQADLLARLRYIDCLCSC